MENKLRKSKQRDAILKTLKHKQTHPTAEDIYNQLKKKFPKISLATIYRNVEQLKNMGLINKIHDPSGPARYEGNTKTHFHIMCEACGRLGDITINKNVLKLLYTEANVHEFNIKNLKVTFVGVCRQCQKSTKNYDSLKKLHGNKH